MAARVTIVGRCARQWQRRRAAAPWGSRGTASGRGSSSTAVPTRAATGNGQGGSTLVTPPDPTPVARVDSSAPPTARSSSGSVSSTPRTRASSTLVERVVNSPAVSRRLPSSRTRRRSHQRRTYPPTETTTQPTRQATATAGSSTGRACEPSHCQASPTRSSGRLSKNWESAPRAAATTTSRERLNGANRSQDQSIRASSSAAGGAGCGATGGRVGSAGAGAQSAGGSSGAGPGTTTGARRSSSTRRRSARIVPSESSSMRVSSTPVPMVTVVSPSSRCSRDDSRSTLRTRSSGAVTTVRRSTPRRTCSWVSVRR